MNVSKEERITTSLYNPIFVNNLAQLSIYEVTLTILSWLSRALHSSLDYRTLRTDAAYLKEEVLSMSRICVFDVNETLLDLRAFVLHFERAFGEAAVRQA